MAQEQRLDPFTRRYLAVLLIAGAVALVWWMSGLDSRVGQLNDLLQADPQLAAYPYQFRVLSLDDGVAEMSSPRSAQVPVVQFLRIVYPELGHTSVTDDAMMAAQDRLASLQSHAGKLVAGQPDVQSIRWSIDKKWYAYHGVYLD